MNHTAPPLGDFLRARRSALSPEAAGIRAGGRRRVPGLRREEVARLAGISPQYYLRLEQGRDRAPSGQVVQALARALRVGEDGAAYMSRLVARESAGVPPAPSAAGAHQAEELLAPYAAQAAFVADSTFDILASSSAARVLSAGEWGVGSNLVISVFGPRMRRGLESWEDCARRVVAALRFRSDPDDPRLRSLVADLAGRDDDFRRIWARHEAHPSYFRPFRQQVEGRGAVDLLIHTFHVPRTPGWTVTVVVPDLRSTASVATFTDVVAGAAPRATADVA
ncbi:helix-turn-helix domain-containing protein [Cellulosimicrobium sp. CUA-896]|uniref:helix-turn-helix domain-containing protein n=1 Tax=Cellulosimicrobium sp. CUA-896 TaxID=1517881 RepID=UPI00095D7019|nr:helix-turn-helix domain-containing protein [Cellulosimicrobium sp. CUA-896]OLT55125.1 hypothetical protein BJF88_07730 [Cellulosimicrobium sp. CUA-896]